MSDALPSTNATDSAETTAEERFCIHCGYNLHGLPSITCPECGKENLPEQATPIPWEHRNEIGLFRSFWRTLKMASFSSNKLMRGAGTGADERSARRFRWIVTALAALPLLITYVAAILYNGNAAFDDLIPKYTWNYPSIPWSTQFVSYWIAGAKILPVPCIGIMVFLLLGTGFSRHFFYTSTVSPTVQYRAGIRSEYLCAPLAWMAIPFASATAVNLLPNNHDLLVTVAYLASVSIYIVSVLAIPILMWWNIVRSVKTVTHCGIARLTVTAIICPTSWVLAFVIGLGLLPFLVGMIWILIDSFRA